MDVVWLGGAAFIAGLVDAVVGGGGLIRVPAIFSFLPKESPASLLGTNKLASICGTGVAAVNYARRAAGLADGGVPGRGITGRHTPGRQARQRVCPERVPGSGVDTIR